MVEESGGGVGGLVDLMTKSICPIKPDASGQRKLHQDAAFMVEVVKRVFVDALGDVNNPFARAPVAAPAPAPADPFGDVGGGVDARSGPDESTVAADNVALVPGAPGCAHGRAALLKSATNFGLCKFLLEQVLENPSLGNVMDPAAVKVHAVELLKLLTKDPGFGMQFGIALDGLPGWRKYKDQDHSLFITGTEQKADYFLTDGGVKDRKMLMN